jgi:hypothetical protein
MKPTDIAKFTNDIYDLDFSQLVEYLLKSPLFESGGNSILFSSSQIETEYYFRRCVFQALLKLLMSGDFDATMAQQDGPSLKFSISVKFSNFFIFESYNHKIHIILNQRWIDELQRLRTTIIEQQALFYDLDNEYTRLTILNARQKVNTVSIMAGGALLFVCLIDAYQNFNDRNMRKLLNLIGTAGFVAGLTITKRHYNDLSATHASLLEHTKRTNTLLHEFNNKMGSTNVNERHTINPNLAENQAQRVENDLSLSVSRPVI